MATTFSGSEGLAAMVFSASFPGRSLTSKFGGTGAEDTAGGRDCLAVAVPVLGRSRARGPCGCRRDQPER